MANLNEIDHALEILESNGSGPVILLHCCSAYPAPVESVNLSAMIPSESLKRLVVSDHTIGQGPIIAQHGVLHRKACNKCPSSGWPRSSIL